MTIFGLFAQLISGLASPAIFAPSFVIGWFVRRWSLEVTFRETRDHLGVES